MMIVDIKVMKQNNINSVRTCCCPNVLKWSDLANKDGFSILDESNVESHGHGSKGSRDCAGFPRMEKGLDERR